MYWNWQSVTVSRMREQALQELCNCLYLSYLWATWHAVDPIRCLPPFGYIRRSVMFLADILWKVDSRTHAVSCLVTWEYESKSEFICFLLPHIYKRDLPHVILYTDRGKTASWLWRHRREGSCWNQCYTNWAFKHNFLLSWNVCFYYISYFTDFTELLDQQCI